MRRSVLLPGLQPPLCETDVTGSPLVLRTYSTAAIDRVEADGNGQQLLPMMEVGHGGGPGNRAQWADRMIADYRPLFERTTKKISHNVIIHDS